jgi:allene oxide cyclase
MRAISCFGVAGILLTGPAFAGDTFVVVEHAVSDKTVHVSTHGDSLGDLLVFANPIYDAANQMQLGSNQGYCVQVVAGKSWECFWTLLLKDGQITAEGPYYESRDSVLAVTGGTGKYAGAKGSLKLHARDSKGTEYDFRYELL